MVKQDVGPEVLHHEKYCQSVTFVRFCLQFDAVGFGDKILATVLIYWLLHATRCEFIMKCCRVYGSSRGHTPQGMVVKGP